MEQIPRRAWAVLAVASATVVLIILDSGFVALGFPEIEDEFVTTPRSTLSWVSSGYFISLASLMLIAGRLAERLGRRRVFLGGLSLYAVGALLMGLAPSVPVLITARFVQGAGAAALTPVSLAIALREFPVSRRSTAIGGWAVLGGSAGVVAPTLGAVLVALGGWRLPFLLLAALLILVGFAAARLLDADVASDQHHAVDLASVALTLLSVGAAALALSKARDWGLGDTRIIATLIIAIVAFPLLLRRSATAEGSLIDLNLFRVRSYAFGSLASMFTQIGFFAFFFTAPLFFTEVWQYSVLLAGFALAFHQGTSAIVGFPLGRLADRIGAASVVAIGGAVAAGSFMWMIAFVTASPNFMIAILPAFALGGIGTMANGAFTTSLALQDISNDVLARASSGYYVTRRIASGIGVVCGAAILGETSGVGSLTQFKLVWLFVGTCYALSGVAARMARGSAP